MQLVRNNRDRAPQTHAVQAMIRQAGWAKPFLPVRRLDRLYSGACQHSYPNVFDGFLEELDTRYDVQQRDIANVPRTGATVVFCNHPFGILDGLMVGSLLLRLRPDVKILTNHFLGGFPELEPYCIYVDPLLGADHQSTNRRGLRSALEHLQAGGLLVVFPSGEVAHWVTREWRVREPEWNPNMARLARIARATCVPMYVRGRNSLGFQLAGMVHPHLRTLQLPHELLNKRGTRVEIRIGAPVAPETLAAVKDDQKAVAMMRWHSYLLSLNSAKKSKRARLKMAMHWPPQRPVAAALPVERLRAELQALPKACLLEQASVYEVYVVTARQAPSIVREIGRLREITFRAAGEGTGKPLDLDRYDAHYTHLVLWNREKGEVVGAYRLGNVQKILRRYGIHGLYTGTLFKFEDGFFAKVPPALELGRSFVRLEYQKQFSPLLLLWKGIGSYIVRHPQTPILFGAVSISNDYSPASRELMTSFLRVQAAADPVLTAMVSPKNPPRISRESKLHQEIFAKALTLESVSDRVSEFERDGKGIPILVKQYLKLGGKMLGFNIDAKFSNVIDGLLMVDLREANPDVLAKYFGKQGVADFLAYHGVDVTKQQTAEAMAATVK